MTVYRSLGARPDATRGTTALEVRKDLASLVTGAGVLPGADSPLVVGSDAFAYVVRSAGWVTSRGSGDGVHLWGNDGDVTISTADDASSLVAPASGLSRIDVVYALHPSATENGDTDSVPVLAVRKGTEASVPIAPSLPTGALELGRNTMTDDATSTSSDGNVITQTAPRAYLSGTGMRRVSRVRTTTNTIPNATFTALGSWNETTHETGLPTDDFSTGGASYTANFDGWIKVRARVAFAVNASGIRAVRLLKGGAALITNRTPAVSVGATDAEATWEGPVSDGDEITVSVYQNSGGSLATEVAGESTTFVIERTA